MEEAEAYFLSVYNQIKSHTLIDEERCRVIWNEVVSTSSLPGDMAECGVFRGGSAKLASRANTGQKIFHIFDTFRGIPRSQRRECDIHPAGRFSETLENVARYLGNCQGVVIHEGLVPDSLEHVKDKEFSYVHLDMDLYEPTLAALYFFWPRMVKSGVILLDDWQALRGINDAINKFAKEIGQKPDHTANVQCRFVK